MRAERGSFVCSFVFTSLLYLFSISIFAIMLCVKALDDVWTIIGLKRHLVLKIWTLQIPSLGAFLYNNNKKTNKQQQQQKQKNRKPFCPSESAVGGYPLWCGHKWDFFFPPRVPIGWLWLTEGGVRQRGPVRSEALQSGGAHTPTAHSSFTPDCGAQWDVEDLVTLRSTWPHLQNRFKTWAVSQRWRSQQTLND